MRSSISRRSSFLRYLVKWPVGHYGEAIARFGLGTRHWLAFVSVCFKPGFLLFSYAKHACVSGAVKGGFTSSLNSCRDNPATGGRRATSITNSSLIVDLLDTPTGVTITAGATYSLEVCHSRKV